MTNLKKKTLILIYFIFFSFNAHSNNNIAYLDIDYIFKNSNFGNKIIEDLNNVNKKYIEDFKNKENKLIKLEKELLKKKNIISQIEFDENLSKLRSEIKLFRNEKSDTVKKFEKKKNDEIKIFFEKVNPIIKKFMKDNSIDILIDKKYIIVGSDNFDITEKLNDILNKELK